MEAFFQKKKSAVTAALTCGLHFLTICSLYVNSAAALQHKLRVLISQSAFVFVWPLHKCPISTAFIISCFLMQVEPYEDVPNIQGAVNMVLRLRWDTCCLKVSFYVSVRIITSIFTPITQADDILPFCRGEFGIDNPLSHRSCRWESYTPTALWLCSTMRSPLFTASFAFPLSYSADYCSWAHFNERLAACDSAWSPLEKPFTLTCINK